MQKDAINNGIAFLSHLKLDDSITYTPQRMTEQRQRAKSAEGQMYETM
jgi:hypothetical protein